MQEAQPEHGIIAVIRQLGRSTIVELEVRILAMSKRFFKLVGVCPG
jgi:hypothetical protein